MNANVFPQSGLLAILAAVGVGIASQDSDAPTAGAQSENTQQTPSLKIEVSQEQQEQYGALKKDTTPSIDLPSIGKYWVGLNCCPCSEALRAQLQITKPVGLVVLDVVAKSPAANAAIQKYDILLKFNETELRNLDDLVEAIDASKDKRSTVELYRKAKRMTLKITPEKRVTKPMLNREQAIQQGLKFLQSTHLVDVQQARPNGIWDIRIVRPAVDVSPPAGKPSFEQSIELRITKDKSGKSGIVVKKDGKSFEARCDNLESLPVDIRTVVEQILMDKQGRTGTSGRIDFSIGGRGVGPETHAFWVQRFVAGQRQKIAGVSADRSRRLDDRLDAINRKLEALQRELAGLKKRK